MKEKFKKLLYFYQKQMWFFQVAVGESRKPLQFANETLLITTFLTVRGIKVGILEIIGIYVFVLLIFIIIGKIMVNLGVVSYITKINNKQNPELMEIIERLANIEKRLNNNK